MWMYTIIPTKKFVEDIEYYEKKKKFRHIDEDIRKYCERDCNWKFSRG